MLKIYTCTKAQMLNNIYIYNNNKGLFKVKACKIMIKKVLNGKLADIFRT